MDDDRVKGGRGWVADASVQTVQPDRSLRSMAWTDAEGRREEAQREADAEAGVEGLVARARSLGQALPTLDDVLAPGGAAKRG